MIKKKKVVSSKSVSKVVEKKASKCCSSWIWWALGILVLLAVLFFAYKGMTGNAITGFATGTGEAFKPIVEMVSGLITSVYEVLKTPLSYLVGATADVSADPDLSTNIFLAKILLLILVLALVSTTFKSSGVDLLKEGAAHWVVSSIVAILAVRFLTPEMIQTILVPYTTFGIVITAVLPFIIYFFFVEKTWGAPKSPVFRKVAWIFFAVVFLSIWIMRYDELKGQEGIVGIIYPLTAMLAVLMCFIDGTIQKILNGWKKERQKESQNAKALHELNELEKRLARAYDDVVAGVSGAQYVKGQVTFLGHGGSSGTPAIDAASAHKAWEEDRKAIRKYADNL